MIYLQDHSSLIQASIDELLFMNWTMSSHFDYAIIKKYLYNKILET